jgi:hypothetical protein
VQLDLRFIVPGPAGGTILLADDGTLPAGRVEGDEDEAAVVAVSAYLRDVLAFRAPVLETHPRWPDVPKGDPIPTLVLTEPAPTGWRPAVGLGFGPIPLVLDGLPAGLAPRAGMLLDELRTGAEPPLLRPRWARRGWQARATGWMIAAAAAARRPLLAEPAPFFLRGISALLRGETAAGGVFMKAVFPPFHAEPAITELLASRFPGMLPLVLATEPDEGWLLVEDVAAPWIGELPETERAEGLRIGARALVAIQQAMTPEIDEVAAVGAPRRPLQGVPAALESALGPDGVAMAQPDVSVDRRDRAVAATKEAVSSLEQLGFPETIVHGDFHAGNAALVDGSRSVIIDWSDAAIGNPAIDLVTWLAWSRDYPAQQRAATDAWVDAWAGWIGEADIRAHLADILVAGSAYQIVSYDGIMRALEPATRYTIADGAIHFFERLEAAMASTTATTGEG